MVVGGSPRFVGSGVRVDKLAGHYMLSIDRGIVQLLRRGIKRVMDMGVALLAMPFSAIFGLFYYLLGGLTGYALFYGERRPGIRGRMVTLPRIRGRSGREGGDLFKPALFGQVLMGRMSLLGPPPGPVEERSAAGNTGRIDYRPGITGIWRLSPGPSYMASCEEELALLQSSSVAGDLLILLRLSLIHI